MKLCKVCNERQFDTTSGITCKNGHGGADSIEIVECNVESKNLPSVVHDKEGIEYVVIKPYISDAGGWVRLMPLLYKS
jgi:hypothetical protein